MQISLLTVVTMILVLVSASAESQLRGLQARKLCSNSGSGEQHGGDCSNTPTYCGSSGNTVSCYYEQPRNRYFEDDIPVEYSDEARTCFDRSSYEWMGQSLQTRCSEGVLEDFPDWCRSDYLMKFGGCSGGCSGTNNCLNLDFYCAEGEYCEMSCTGENSCKGLTMHCADKQFCELQCNGNDSCVGAKVTCGKGSVARGLGCEPADQPNDCGSQIQSLTFLDEVCSECAEGCWMPNSPFFQGKDKCQTTNLFNGNVLLTEKNCNDLKSIGYADRWCGPKAQDPVVDGLWYNSGPPAQDPVVDDFWNNSKQSCNDCGGFWPITQPANCHDKKGNDLTKC